jgi:hypothetical protein
MLILSAIGFILTSYSTFREAAERIRGTSNILAPKFFRTFDEDSKTLCSYETIDTHAKNIEVPDSILQEQNAFQALGTPQVRDFTRERVERHLSWLTRKDPSSFISVFNSGRECI